ncbi:MAG: hypothetical protein IT427_02505 [Pirellulales bacterium]|nr:hypothetical protein [Pirellulales bacterium]
MIPHTIRLRHPWDPSPAADGRIAYLRRFNRPTNLDAWERVSLEIDRAMSCGEVGLNGRLLGSLKVGEFFAVDVTDLLQASNELRVEIDPATTAAAPPITRMIYVVDVDEPLGSPIGDARLVIRAVQAADKISEESHG